MSHALDEGPADGGGGGGVDEDEADGLSLCTPRDGPGRTRGMVRGLVEVGRGGREDGRRRARAARRASSWARRRSGKSSLVDILRRLSRASTRRSARESGPRNPTSSNAELPISITHLSPDKDACEF